MGVPQSPTPPHLYPQALQLKLYQAFIFSIPILFSIILFLLFYLFYLKRRASNTLSPPIPRPRRSHQTTTYVSSTCQLDFKVEIKEELPVVLFDEELRKKDSQCCVCLGDFEMKEELLQVPSCKHIFHIDCINLWLHTNTTCPLCRCSILANNIPSKLDGDDHPNYPPQSSQIISSVSSQNQQIAAPLETQQEEHQASTSSNTFPSFSRQVQDDHMPRTIIAINDESSNNYGNSAITSTSSSNSAGRLSLSQLPNRDSDNSGQGSVVIHIQTHGTEANL